jgi:hypothetical protein
MDAHTQSLIILAVSLASGAYFLSFIALTPRHRNRRSKEKI